MHSIVACTFALCLAGIISTTVYADDANSASTGRVSNEDIRDAVLSLIHMLRDNTDKMERHESRERQLGEQLKKSLAALEKKPKIEESSQVLETLSAINRRLESIESAISKEQSIQKRMGDIEESIRRNELGIEYIRSNSVQKLDTILSNVLDQRLSTDNRTSGNMDFANLEIKLTNIESFQDKLETISTLQRNAIEEMTRTRQSISEYSNGSYQISHSLTQKLDELLHEIGQCETGRCHNQTEKTHSLINENHRAMLSAISESSVLRAGENNGSDRDGYRHDDLLKELKDLSKIKPVLIQTADNVLDTRRRIEYATQHIVVEIGAMVRLSSKETNETVNKRFDTISTEILGSTNGALQNLSSKLETEISQVWRQIGNMYQTLTNSAESLDKLQQQTEVYVNSSSKTMESMKGKVGLITNRMSEVDENLNYLLGRLSLVTQEFNQIKIGLGEALDNIRKSFHSVQDKVKETGPGPNPIEEESISVVVAAPSPLRRNDGATDVS